MKILTFDEAIEQAVSAARAGREGVFLSIADKIGFAVGAMDDTCDRAAIEAQGGRVYEGLWHGGTIVVFPKDISICVLTKDYTDIGHRLLMASKEYLEQRGLMVSEVGNDLMLTLGSTEKPCGRNISTTPTPLLSKEGKETLSQASLHSATDTAALETSAYPVKVGSWAVSQLPHKLVETVVHISIGMDAELISKVCSKPMQKKVGIGLGELGIEAEEMLDSLQLII